MYYVFPLRGGHRFNISVGSKFSLLGLLRTRYSCGFGRRSSEWDEITGFFKGIILFILIIV